ncbi:hypothetical protein ColTof4_11913 [Colletotrichum tofieldiae]|nr:hypothetical protein ColTof3_03014 [Colletotrichum tofieldiae]GKT79490.1 hypothetical protein ColTof4_11913 [Colletotrichum tofieldiae]
MFKKYTSGQIQPGTVGLRFANSSPSPEAHAPYPLPSAEKAKNTTSTKHAHREGFAAVGNVVVADVHFRTKR